MTDSSTTPATSAAPVADEPPRRLVVAQIALNSNGPDVVKLHQDAKLLDVHAIDGTFHLRVLQPEDAAPEDFETVQVLPAALGTVLEVDPGHTLVAPPVRGGGIHFFLVR